MKYAGKERIFEYKGKSIRLLNQSCPEWTHPYIYDGEPADPDTTLHSAGCGIFSIAHLIDWVAGAKVSVEDLADFSCANGGRGDDGTDRPALLAAMQKAGRLEKAGLEYRFDGLLNDHQALWDAMVSGGCALCDLHEGHIVALVDWREQDGERQLLVIDSSRDSMHPSVRTGIREIVPGSQALSQYVNEYGVRTGMDEHYAMFWVPLEMPFDFNLLHRIG
jgi:hypothetical protein